MTGSLIGTQIEGYRIESELGKGGMGVVYKARGHGKIAVVKTILPDAVKNDVDHRIKQRFMREAELLKKLSTPQHPNIVGVYEYGALSSRKDLLYIILEYVDGGDLSKYAESRNLRIKDLLDILDRIAQSLDYIHEREIVHRDLKPQNILMTSNGIPKLSDFGLARVEDNRHITRYGDRMTGTLLYMAPEQISSNKVEAPADRYAFAVMAYYLLLGGFPYPLEVIENEAQILNCIAVTPPLPASARDKNLPPRVDDVFVMALAKSPDERYRSARDFVHDLSLAYRGKDLVALPKVLAEQQGDVVGEKLTEVDIDTWSKNGKLQHVTDMGAFMAAATLTFGIAVVGAGAAYLGRKVAEKLEVREQVRVYYTIADVLASELKIDKLEAFVLTLQLTTDEGASVLERIPKEIILPQVTTPLDVARRVMLRVQVIYRYVATFHEVPCETEIYFLSGSTPRKRVVTDTLYWDKLPFDIREKLIRDKQDLIFKVYPGI